MNGIIYKYTYLPTGESYIGQTTNFTKRQRDHLSEDRTNLRFHNLLRKHYNDFKIEILEENISTIQELNKKEKFYIKKYNTYLGFGFNLTEGGDGGFQACNNYWKNNPKKMQEHIKRIQPLAAQASKEYWKNNPEWKQQHLKEMKNGWKKWKENNEDHFKENLKNAHLKAKEWRENNKEVFENNRKKAVEANKKKVKLLNTGEIFNSITEAANYYNICATSISACCKGKRQSAGKNEKGEKLVWEYI